MNHLRLLRKNRAFDEASWNKFRQSEIERHIRERYTVSEELAILRQRDSKPDEFADYNAYVEQCKADVDMELAWE